MAERINIMGVPVDMVNYEEALARFRTFVEEDGVSLIVTPNSEIVVNAGKNEELMAAIRQAEMVIPDGIGLVSPASISWAGLWPIWRKRGRPPSSSAASRGSRKRRRTGWRKPTRD